MPNGNSTSKSWLFLLGLYRRKKQITFMTYPHTSHVCPSTFFFAVLLLVYILSTDALSIICSTSFSSVNIYSIICIGALANIVYIPHSDVERLRLEKWCNIYKFALKYSRSTHGRKKQTKKADEFRPGTTATKSGRGLIRIRAELSAISNRNPRQKRNILPNQVQLRTPPPPFHPLTILSLHTHDMLLCLPACPPACPT